MELEPRITNPEEASGVAPEGSTTSFSDPTVSLPLPAPTACSQSTAEDAPEPDTPSPGSPSPDTPSLGSLSLTTQHPPLSPHQPPLEPTEAAPCPVQPPSPTHQRASRSIFARLNSRRTPSNSDGSHHSGSSSNSVHSRNSIKSYRSMSSHSPLYMFKNAMTSCKELPFEQTSLTEEQFQVFARLTREQQIHDAPGTRTKIIARIFYFIFLICFIYFFLVGMPIWPGAVVWFWRFYHGDVVEHVIWGMIAFLLAGTIRNILPQLFCTFQRGIPCSDTEKPRDASECCIIIPCYKAAETLRTTIPACLRVFRPEQIFIIANGNSETPLDNTADVCAEYGVRHFWVPVGSKITAEFVGVAVAREYKYCMLIDDDVLIPANLPLPTYHFDDCGAKNRVACVGYTIKSVGPNSSRGTLIQQAQDLEYKVSGLAKVFQMYYGSVVFPHGAIALWRRDVLEKIFHAHPGYHISEDWYLGHTARAAGYRMVMSSQLFVETETPPRLFPPIFNKNAGSRGGYGEMSIYKQRFFRWNFFFLFRMWNNFTYIIFSWRLGWREIITKLYVFGEIYDSLIRLVAPIVYPISMAANWRLTLVVTGSLMLLSYTIFIFFNTVHLTLLRRGRPDKERVSWAALPAYAVLKFVMVFVNIASVYWSIYEYAFFFTQQHLMVTENVAAWQVIRASHRGSLPAVQEGEQGVFA